MWYFTLNIFLSNDWTVGLGQVMFEYNFYLFFSMIASLLLSSSNDVSDHPCAFTSVLQQALPKQHPLGRTTLVIFFTQRVA